MTRDPFGHAAISTAVSSYRASQELHLTAMPTPLRHVEIKSLNQPNATTEVVMGGELCNESDGRNAYPGVHRCTPDRYQPATEDQAIALRLLKSVPAPLSIERVSRALQWSKGRARRWIERFAAKGVLRPTGSGHVWAEEQSR